MVMHEQLLLPPRRPDSSPSPIPITIHWTPIDGICLYLLYLIPFFPFFFPFSLLLASTRPRVPQVSSTSTSQTFRTTIEAFHRPRAHTMEDPTTAPWGLPISDEDFAKLQRGLRCRSSDDKWVIRAMTDEELLERELELLPDSEKPELEKRQSPSPRVPTEEQMLEEESLEDEPEYGRRGSSGFD